MLTINATPFKSPIGLSTGKYTPYAVLTDNKCVDLDTWSDGTSGTHGLLYPINYATTEQTLINTNMTAAQGIFTIDDNSYATTATKKKILGNFYNEYKNVSRVGLFLDDMFANSTTLNASTGARRIVEIATDKVAVVYIDSADSSKCKVLIVELTNNGTATAGSVYTLDNTAICYTPNVVALGTDKFVATWGRSNTQHASVCTVSGTVVTVGSAASATTNSSSPNGIVKLDTDKFAMSFVDNTSSNMEVIAATVSGTTISFGTKATVLTGTGTPFVGGNSTQGCRSMQQLDTNKIFLIWNETSTYNYCAITFSGTTPTIGTNSTLSNSSFQTVQRTDTALVTTNKVVVVGGTATATNAVIISFSGTTASAGTIATALTTVSTMYSRSVIARSSTDILVACVATISSSTGLYANQLSVSGNNFTRGDMHNVVPFTTTVYGNTLIQTTNYSVMVASAAASLSIRMYAVRHGNVTITVNGEAFATSSSVKLLSYIGSPVAIGGRKVYLAITNNNAFTQSIPMGYVYANVE